jgi:plastocyanin
MMIMMMAWMLAFWAALIGVVVLAARWIRRDAARNGARATLDERLARGEITPEEHRRLRTELSRPRPGATSLVRPGIAAAAVLVAMLVVVPAIAMAAGGCSMWNMDMHGRGANTSASPLVQADRDASVTVRDFAFTPGNLSVPVGATVTWTNEDSAPHDATARDGNWRTGRLSEGESETVTFDAAGEYDYYCSIHPSMKARLLVRS